MTQPIQQYHVCQYCKGPVPFGTRFHDVCRIRELERQLAEKRAKEAGVVPVRLPGERRAYLILPDQLTKAEAEHICEWVHLSVEPPTEGDITPPEKP